MACFIATQLLFFVFVTLMPLVICDKNFFPIRFKNCKSRFEVLSVEITECPQQDRCIFARSSEHMIRIAFKPDRKVDELKTSVWAHLGDAHGALTKFHIENDDACSGSNITCPVQPFQVYWYTQAVRILPEYPAVDVQVNWLLTDPTTVKNEQGLPQSREVCIKFLGNVKDVEE